jgi:hypothetical protein
LPSGSYFASKIYCKFNSATGFDLNIAFQHDPGFRFVDVIDGQ